MRHVFILNPAAGKHARALELREPIAAYFEAHGGEYAVHITQAAGDATAIARAECAAGDPVRLYACGGDGTLMEVAGGIRDCCHAQLTVIPCGSANDYIRSFGEEARFRDLDALIGGNIRYVDAIAVGDRLSLNICSVGLDADVAGKMSRYKHLPLVSGPMAYNLALVDVFFHTLGKELRVEMDTPEGVLTRGGRFMLALAANGQYYGGGYRGAPQAVADDGWLDFLLIDEIPRAKVLSVLQMFRRGEHLSLPCCHTYCGNRMTLFAREPVVVNVDGECFSGTEVTFTLLKSAFAFVVPAGLPAATPAVPAQVEI